MTLQVPFVDLRAQLGSIREEIKIAIDHVIENADFILGEEVARFETNFASYLDVPFVIGTGSGLDALRLALVSMGIGAGDEVIIPANTYIATALAISAVGAIPILVDVDTTSFNLDISAIEQAITTRTRAVIVVHLYGQPADMDELLALVVRYKLRLIEDACQSHGARYRGKRTGTFGDAGCFSFYPSKNLGGFGDGGAVVTRDAQIAQELRQLRNYGQQKKYHSRKKGFNSRLDTLQAAVLNVKLKYLDQWNRERTLHAQRYSQLLKDIPQVKTPQTYPERDHIFHLYVIRCEERDRLNAYLSDHGIQSQIHYPVPLYLQDAYADLNLPQGSFPRAEKLAGEILSLPMYPELQLQQIEHVAATISAFYS
jgi:dTDP-4-amino-4,6-dideoxygalactose transaminase